MYRPEFESALRAHFRGDSVSADDPAWFALRKAVYASGCRTYLSKYTSRSFKDIQREAWSYFQGAMSVLTELLFTPSGLLAVRALCAMVRTIAPDQAGLSVLIRENRRILQKDSAIPHLSTCYVQIRPA